MGILSWVFDTKEEPKPSMTDVELLDTLTSNAKKLRAEGQQDLAKKCSDLAFQIVSERKALNGNHLCNDFNSGAGVPSREFKRIDAERRGVASERLAEMRGKADAILKTCEEVFSGQAPKFYQKPVVR